MRLPRHKGTAALIGATLLLASGSVSAQNLVINPGFELGLLGWTTPPIDGWFADASPHTGALAAGANSQTLVPVSQSISLAPGRWVELVCHNRGVSA